MLSEIYILAHDLVWGSMAKLMKENPSSESKCQQGFDQNLLQNASEKKRVNHMVEMIGTWRPISSHLV